MEPCFMEAMGNGSAAGVAPGAVVEGNLMRGKELFHFQVIFQVYDAQIPPEAGDPAYRSPQGGFGDRASGEQGVKLSLLADDISTKRHGLFFHIEEHGFCSRKLPRSQLNFGGAFDDMGGAGEVIQLGGFREAKALALQKLLDFGGRERLDPPFFLSGVGGFRGRGAGESSRAEGGEEREDG